MLVEASVDCPGFRGGTAQVVLFLEQPWVTLQDHASSQTGKPVCVVAARNKERKHVSLLNRAHVVGCGGPFPNRDLGVGRCLSSDRSH